MKHFTVESRMYPADCFDNYVGGYIVAETEEEAIRHYQDWLLENGLDPEEIQAMEYRAKRHSF